MVKKDEENALQGTATGKPRLFLSLVFVLALVTGLSIATPLPGKETTGGVLNRFFLHGDGKLRIRNEHNGKEASVNLVAPDGTLDEKALSAIDRVFGFPTNEKGEHVSLRLLFMLDFFSDLMGHGKAIRLSSGYRDPEYNEKLKQSGGNVARTSTHLDGMAIDFSIDGVNSKKLWAAIREKSCGGVGHYGGREIHLDAGRPRFWEAATSKTTTNESESNRRIHLSTEYDRYRQGEQVRLFFSSVSDFGFGIGGEASLVREGEEQGRPIGLRLPGNDASACLPVPDRRASRFIFTDLPRGLEPGRYRLRLTFCNRPFEEMPQRALSNGIEVLPRPSP
jgi:uncharacterized protein YcbK (DUF882 family)